MRASVISGLVLLLAQSISAQPTGASGCTVKHGDKEWPAEAVWKAELPGVEQQQDGGGETHPDYLMVAKTVKDVQAAVKFSAKHNVRLTLISSGHDFLGRNDATSGLWLSTGNFKGSRVHAHFTPSVNGTEAVDYNTDPVGKVNVVKVEAGKETAITFGVGVSGQELTDALDKSGLYTLGATASTVKTAGGYAQTAGHAAFSNKWGLAADNILEYKVVTADGELKIANDLSNKDLFWALRGGGGGTFGVVVEATMRAFPTPKITQTKIWIELEDHNNTDAIFPQAAYMHSKMPDLSDAGWSCYFYVYGNGFQARFINPDSTQAAAEKAFAPILAGLPKTAGVKQAIHQYSEVKNFKVWFDSLFGAAPAQDPAQPLPLEGAYPRGISHMDSRLLGRAHLESPKLAAALKEGFPKGKNGMWRGHLIGGGKVMKTPADFNSVNPAWRKTYVHIIGTGVEQPNATPLRTLAPDMGSYVNEAFAHNPDWKQTFWGTNYPRLYSIKKAVDPNGLFWVTPGIGADDFKLSEGRLCKVQGPAKDAMYAPDTDNKNMAESTGARPYPKSQEEADNHKGASWP
ncbi:FAD-binding domain-containing protein [Microthyrium microscopicum]|uniref:FAD-binding domain-containing protein n=1 Tax=Microthyrium microscopicum TaxID=703497 RepID=A0A6A6UC29_9PEZI|nr:FAD-binding domain-containing protein [Microthyrium microscopicum]